MRNLNNIDSLVMNPGIYFNAKDCNSLRGPSVIRKTLRKRLRRKLGDKHYMIDKIKIAFSLLVIVAVLSKMIIG